RRDDPLARDVDLDRRLGRDAAGGVLGREIVGDHPERFDREPRLLPAAGAPHEQLERRVGDLEVVARVLELLELVDDRAERRPDELDAQLLRLQVQGRAARELRDDEARAVADRLRTYVLVRVGTARDRARVQTGL